MLTTEPWTLERNLRPCVLPRLRVLPYLLMPSGHHRSVHDAKQADT